jgi:hypothetical protein
MQIGGYLCVGHEVLGPITLRGARFADLQIPPYRVGAASR